MTSINWPTPKELTLLKRAAAELRFLLTRGYDKNPAINFIGNHYQLNKLYRHLLFRAIFPRHICQLRRQKKVIVAGIEGKVLLIDGYNCFITLESAIKGKPVIRCDDGFVRDVSGVFRAFTPSHFTYNAWTLMQRVFTYHRPNKIIFFLDAPYSNSKRFCRQIREWMYSSDIIGDCILTKRSEKEFGHLAGIKVSGDSVIIDNSSQVFDLSGHIISRMLRIKPIRL